MKTKILSLLVVLAVAALVMACATAPTEMGDPKMAAVNAQNDQLAKIPVTGFEYKSSALPAITWDAWAEKAAPVVKGILDKLPEGYVLQVTGHTDGRGPENPVGAKPGNIKISSDRAKAVYNSLVKKGITSPNLTYKGVGSSEMIPGFDPSDAQQRRVSFKVVPKS